jgi:hypothetical protein
VVSLDRGDDCGSNGTKFVVSSGSGGVAVGGLCWCCETVLTPQAMGGAAKVGGWWDGEWQWLIGSGVVG